MWASKNISTRWAVGVGVLFKRVGLVTWTSQLDISY